MNNKGHNVKNYLFLSRLLVLTGMTLASMHHAFAATDPLTVQFTSTIEAGTCNAQLKDNTGVATSTIDFGDVFKTDLSNKARKVDFKLSFTGCSGVRSALINTQITGGCSGPNGDGDSYANSGGTAAAVAVELWNGQPDSGTQFSCKSRSTQQEIPVSGQTQDLDLSARMVIANQQSISDVTAGSFLSTVTFVITYR